MSVVDATARTTTHCDEDEDDKDELKALVARDNGGAGTEHIASKRTRKRSQFGRGATSDDEEPSAVIDMNSLPISDGSSSGVGQNGKPVTKISPPSPPQPDKLLTLPSTFNVQPELVRRLSTSVANPAEIAENFRRWQNAEKSEIKDTQLLQEDEEESRGLFGIVRRRSKPKTRRVCEKNGEANVTYKNISERRRRYLTDIYTTLVDARWSTCLSLFATSFYSTWMFYAVVYYMICWNHGDFDEGHLPKDQEANNWTPCVVQMDGFAAAFLFSLETQHTIGYGSRATTTECAEAIIVMSTQSVIGCLIQAFMVGLVFAKLSTPNKRARTVVFSKHSVICERDKKLCLVFRVGDMRPNSYIVGTQISAKLIRRRVTEEGEMFHDVSPIAIKPDCSEETCIFLLWPATIIHEIDDESPFYRMSAPELSKDKFEIHIALEGTIESTSMTFQARTSYLPNEILWGHRFEPMMLYRKDHNKYQVNFSAFNSTYEVDTPLCSSKDLQRHYRELKKYQRAFNNQHPAHQSPHLFFGTKGFRPARSAQNAIVSPPPPPSFQIDNPTSSGSSSDDEVSGNDTEN